MLFIFFRTICSISSSETLPTNWKRKIEFLYEIDETDLYFAMFLLQVIILMRLHEVELQIGVFSLYFFLCCEESESIQNNPFKDRWRKDAITEVRFYNRVSRKSIGERFRDQRVLVKVFESLRKALNLLSVKMVWSHRTVEFLLLWTSVWHFIIESNANVKIWKGAHVGLKENFF